MTTKSIFEKWFIEATDYLWDQHHQKKLTEDTIFDFPDYADMPAKISNKLSGDFVDVIQYLWKDLIHRKFRTKIAFRKAILQHHAWDPTEALKIDSILKMEETLAQQRHQTETS